MRRSKRNNTYICIYLLGILVFKKESKASLIRQYILELIRLIVRRININVFVSASPFHLNVSLCFGGITFTFYPV